MLFLFRLFLCAYVVCFGLFRDGRGGKATGVRVSGRVAVVLRAFLGDILLFRRGLCYVLLDAARDGAHRVRHGERHGAEARQVYLVVFFVFASLCVLDIGWVTQTGIFFMEALFQNHILDISVFR